MTKQDDLPLTVREALLAMTQAIRQGEMLQAKGFGERCVVPLGLTSEDVKFIGKLSEGAESTVYHATWHGRDVAVKKARIATSADLDRFKRELELLSSLQHPAVVPLLGARVLPPDYWLVLPLAAGGNVRQALYDNEWRPNWREVLELAYAVAGGMEAVHAADVIHRDLKPANLLLPESSPLPQLPATAAAAPAGTAAHTGPASCNGDVRCSGVLIADFGLAVRVDSSGAAAEGEGEAAGAAVRRKPSGGFHKERVVGTLEYMAPELLLRSAPASKAADVYAWAVTVNEVATGVVPFSDCTKDNPEVHTVLEMGYGRMELAAAVCAEGLRPLLPRGCPPGFAALLGACWAREPQERPSFTQVRRALEGLMEELPLWEQQQQQHVTAAATISVGPWKMISAVEVPEPHAHKAVVVAELATAADSNDGGVDCAAASAADHANGAMRHCTTDADVRDAPGATAKALLAPLPPLPSERPPAAPAPAAQAVLAPFTICPEGDDEAAAALAVGADAYPSWLLQPPAQQQNEAHAADGPTFNAGVFEAVGPRDSMEDRYVLLYDVLGRPLPTANQHNHQHHASTPRPQQHLQAPEQHPPAVTTTLAQAVVPVPVAAVFDGHRGAEAAEFCRTQLPAVLRAAVRGSVSPAAALRRAFVRLEEEYHTFWRQHRQRHPGAASGPHAFPGTTALVAMMAPGGRLFIANAGDCRAVLCRRRRAVAGSRDHTGLLEDERRRLEAAGVGVTWQHGGWRVGVSGLQVTRCIGDFDVKGGVPGTAAAAGVTAVPEVTCVELQPDVDHFLILASDGLWDVMSVQEATGLVYDTVKDPVLAAKRLATEALMRGSADNVTVAVVFLTHLDTVERVYGTVDGEAYEITGTAYGSRVRLEKDRHLIAAMDEVRDTY